MREVAQAAPAKKVTNSATLVVGHYLGVRTRFGFEAWVLLLRVERRYAWYVGTLGCCRDSRVVGTRLGIHICPSGCGGFESIE